MLLKIPMNTAMYLYKYNSSSQRVELVWHKAMQSPDLEMSNARLGLLVTHAVSAAISQDFIQENTHDAVPSEGRCILKVLFNGCLRLRFTWLFERDLKTKTKAVIIKCQWKCHCFNSGWRAACVSRGPKPSRVSPGPVPGCLVSPPESSSTSARVKTIYTQRWSPPTRVVLFFPLR